MHCESPYKRKPLKNKRQYRENAIYKTKAQKAQRVRRLNRWSGTVGGITIHKVKKIKIKKTFKTKKLICTQYANCGALLADFLTLSVASLSLLVPQKPQLFARNPPGKTFLMGTSTDFSLFYLFLLVHYPLLLLR